MDKRHQLRLHRVPTSEHFWSPDPKNHRMCYHFEMGSKWVHWDRLKKAGWKMGTQREWRRDPGRRLPSTGQNAVLSDSHRSNRGCRHLGFFLLRLSVRLRLNAVCSQESTCHRRTSSQSSQQLPLLLLISVLFEVRTGLEIISSSVIGNDWMTIHLCFWLRELRVLNL